MNKPLRLWNDYDRPHSDLREAIERMERAGELLRIRGADWKLEMGTLAEIVYRQDNPPAIVFEDIPGYPGCRAVSGLTNSARRLAITLGFPVPSHPLDVVRAYRDRMKVHKPIPPRVVNDGPVLENVLKGSDVNVLKFPAPLLHEQDGGRYLGTDDLVIMRDPEENWVNCGTYRSMVQGPDRVGLWMSPGKHGRQIREKYFKLGQPCPVLISLGHEPLLFLVGGVRGVWVHEVGCARMFNVISIKQAYAGHAKQAAMLAASCQSGSYLGRFVVVVDEDVDPTNLDEVVWAMCTRCDPAEDIDFIRKHWSGPLDPRLPKGVTWNSRGLIDACRPLELLGEFPPVVKASAELRSRVEQKFADQLHRKA